MADEYLTKEQAARQLNLSVRRFMELVADGTLKGEKRWNAVTRRNAVMIRQGEIERYLNSQAVLKAKQAVLPAPVAAAAGDVPSWFLTAQQRYDLQKSILRNPDIGDREALGRLAAMRPWLTLDEAAEYAGLPAAILRRLIEEGRLPALDVGVRPGGRWRVRRGDLDALEGVRLTDRAPSTDSARTP